MTRMDFPIIKESIICSTSIIRIAHTLGQYALGTCMEVKGFHYWNYVPTALAPDEDYDKFGCFQEVP